MKGPVVYDKAKYHAEEVQTLGLPEEQACVHTALFIGWLADHDLYSEEFAEDSNDQIQAYKDRRMTAVQVYQSWDGCLVDDMLSDEGNAFAQSYFGFKKGKYLKDYAELLVKTLPTEFHVLYTWDNQAIMSARIDERYSEWRESNPNIKRR